MSAVRDLRFISPKPPLLRHLVCDQVKTSGCNNTEGREEVGVARLTPAVLQTAVARGTGSSPGNETIRGDPPTVTEHASVVLGGRDPVRPMRKEPISFAGRDLPVWATGGRAPTVRGLRMVHRQTSGCDGDRPERVIRQLVGSESILVMSSVATSAAACPRPAWNRVWSSSVYPLPVMNCRCWW